MLIIPEFSTNYSYPKQCRQYKLSMYDKGYQVGEAFVAIANYADILDANQTLDTVAKYHIEDMHLAFSALNKHPIFTNSITSHPILQGRSPIIAYLTRIYIFPEYRNQRLSYDFLSQLPLIIQEISFTYPLAIAVYISPQSYLTGPDGNQPIPPTDVKKMKKQMKHMFKQAGYERTSLSPLHKDSLCWFDPKLR